MIKSIEFKNFRNLNEKFEFDEKINIIFGNNNSGKSNLLDGIKMAFSSITGDYFKINKSDFYDSNDSNPIIINVELEYNFIPSLNFLDENNNYKCGFKIIIKKTQTRRYVKDLSLLNGSPIDFDYLRNDEKIPNLFSLPLARVDDIYSDGLITGITKFIESEERYMKLKSESKDKIKEEIKSKREEFQKFCKKFNQNLDVELSEPKISDEKLFIINDTGEKEHNYRIGSGYKSIANIILNTLNDNYNIILIDEIENHLHPSLIRTLLRELRNTDSIKNTMIISTTHSPVIINEAKMNELISISGKRMDCLCEINKRKLEIFLHSGRSELMLSDYVILVEGYTEELILNNYLYKHNYNWTVVNVAGIMFEPYIELAITLDKNVIVISDDDKALSESLEVSKRFENLKEYCKSKNVTLLEIDNTLETDLYNNNFLGQCIDLLDQHKNHPEIYVSKQNRKIEIVEKLIEDDIDLSKWHVIESIKDEFNCN